MTTHAKLALVLAISATGFSARSALAQYSVTTLGSSVTYENFNSWNGNGSPTNWTIGALGNNNSASGNANIAANTIQPNSSLGWGVDNGTSSSLAGVYIVNGNPVINTTNGNAITNGTNISGGFRAFVNGSDTSNRSLGYVANGATDYSVMTAAFQNNSGSTITSLTLSYVARQFLANSARGSALLVTYSVDGTTFVPFGAATNFNSNNSAAAVTTLNGYAVGNFANKTGGASGLSIANGNTFYVRWNYSGSANGGAGSRQGLAIDDVALNVSDASATPYTPQDQTWTAASGRAWNTTDANWSGALSNTYTEMLDPTGTHIIGDNAIFSSGSPAEGTVNIVAGGVNPSSVKVTGGSYTFAGGQIKGATSVSVTGGGVVTFAASNGFAGGTILSNPSGTIVYAAAGALGTGPIDIESGTLSATASGSIGGLTFTTGTSVATISVAAGQTITFSGANSAPFITVASTVPTLNITGPGAVVFSSAYPSSAIGLNVTGGRLSLNQPSGSTAILVDDAWANSMAGDVVIGGPWRFNLEDNGTGGNLTLGASNTTGKLIMAVPSGTNAAGDVGSSLAAITAEKYSGGTYKTFTINMGIQLNGTSNASRFAVGATATTVDFSGSTPSVTRSVLNLDAPITGIGSLYFGTTTTSQGGTNYVTGSGGTVNLFAASSSYSGDTYIAGDLSGIVRLQVDNPLPAASLLHFGDKGIGTNISAGALDLNGHAVTIGGLTGTPIAGSTQTYGGVVNTNGTGNVVITGAGVNTYGGPIGGTPAVFDGGTNNNINLSTDPAFTGTQSLTGVITTTGTITAKGGQIVVAPSSFGTHFPTLGASTGTGKIVAIANAALSSTDLTQVANNEMIVRSGQTEAAVDTLVSAWYQGGTRAGTTGLASSTAGTGTGPDKYATLAVISNSNGAGGSLFTSFFGLPVSSTDVLVKYTYLGDTDLNGTVDSSDLANLLAGKNGGLTGWVNGDINYDGVVNDLDLNLLMSSLRNQTTPFDNGTGTVGAVPEPSALALAAIAIPMLGRRRRV